MELLINKFKSLFSIKSKTDNAIEELQRHDWFIQLYSNSRFRELIHHDEGVREFIAMNYSREMLKNDLKTESFQNRFIDCLIAFS